eukprot:COSAG02_NODE_180_length_31057_cov_21.869501_12_plen_117_part_00
MNYKLSIRVPIVNYEYEYSAMVAWSADQDALLKKLCEQHTKEDGRVDWSAVVGAATGALAARTQKSLARRWAKRDGREEAKQAAKVERRAPKRAAAAFHPGTDCGGGLILSEKWQD